MDSSQVTPLDWSAKLLAEFVPSVEANPYGYGSPLEVLRGALAFEVVQDNRRALVAVRPLDREQGRRLDVLGLVSTGDRVSAALMCEAMDKIAASMGANLLTMATMRDHVQKTAERAGWKKTGVVMIKKIGSIQ